MRFQSIVPLLAALSIHGGSAHAADPGNSPAGAAPESHVSVLTGAQVVQILDDTVDWYRTLGTQQQNATQPSDLLILFANRQTADKVIALAFDIARANAELLSSEASSGNSAANVSAQQSLGQQQDQLDAQRLSIQQKINAAQQQKLTASGKVKQDIDAKLTELQGELAMVNARKNLLDTMTDFVNESDPKAAGANALKAQIEAIAATIPAASANPAAAPSISTPSTAAGPGRKLRRSPARPAGQDSGALRNMGSRRQRAETTQEDRHHRCDRSAYGRASGNLQEDQRIAAQEITGLFRPQRSDRGPGG